MFGEFLKRLTAERPAPIDGTDVKLALGALLVRIARSDGDYSAIEAEHITRILASHFDLSAAEADAMRTDAEVLEAEAPDTVRFTRAIKDAVSHEDREEVVEALWELVLADGNRDHEEDGILRLVAPLLGINDRDSALARQRVVARMG
ncbi:MAG: TerB family tellurite resistance protein [Litoreibacter sp.]|nr:TerB family tellurite resistance protein [Litoreibacter sp.]